MNLRVRDAAACRAFYAEHFGFEPAFEAEGGFFLRSPGGFLLAVVPAVGHRPLPDGFHIGFSASTADEVVQHHQRLVAAGVRVTDVDDHRPGEDYFTFRCWDPDGTEVEVFWDGQGPAT
jgi:catechol 2,3-dioxygenase-like lactoylglutathione lyase family enzyme